MKPFISLSTNKQLLRNSKERKCHIDMKPFYIADSFAIIVLFNLYYFFVLLFSLVLMYLLILRLCSFCSQKKNMIV